MRELKETGPPDWPTPAEIRLCSVCTRNLQEPFGWCANCRAAFCAECGAAHYCMPTCRAAGCHAGLCVRLVRDGAVVPNSWGMRE